jgi:hypothetical protein
MWRCPAIGREVDNEGDLDPASIELFVRVAIGDHYAQAIGHPAWWKHFLSCSGL